jgi:hypothetical protein
MKAIMEKATCEKATAKGKKDGRVERQNRKRRKNRKRRIGRRRNVYFLKA